MKVSYKKTSVYYSIKGDGGAVILLHGFLENSSMWQNISDSLCKTHKVICIDLLGHGQTGCIDHLHTMEMMADAVYEVIKYLNIEKTNIIGHSMGGYVALALANKHPSILKSLCLMNSTFESDCNHRKALRARANEMAKKNFKNFIRLSFTNLFSEHSKEKHKTAYKDTIQEALKTPLKGFIAANNGMTRRHNHFKLFKNLKTKKAIIVGKKDGILDFELIKEKTKKTDIKIIEFSEGHMSHIENEEELIYFFKNFLKDYSC